MQNHQAKPISYIYDNLNITILLLSNPTVNNVLSIKNLNTVFINDGVEFEAVKSVSFDIPKGSTIGIVGESGSGKSVTSLSLMRLLPSPPGFIKNGTVEYTSKSGVSKDLLAISEADMCTLRGNAISMIFQEPMSSLNPTQRCGKQVAEAILIHNKVSKSEAKAQVISLFERVQLPDPERIYRSYPHEMSGGQIQRVMIAMAVANHPEVLIADEPTTALDVTVQKEIIKLLSEIKNEFDTSTIFISHDLGVIKEIADYVIVMYKGQIVEQGEAQELFNNPKHAYTKGLIACRPPMDRRMHRLPVISDFMERSDDDLGQENFVSSLIEPISDYQARIIGLDTEPEILRVENLSTYYTAKKNFFGRPTAYTKAVDDVSFTMKKGETLGLVGESGSGKSTLGKSILRLIPATAGKVYFEDKDVFDLDKKSMRKLRKDYQIIFQDPFSSLNPRMRIGAAIQEPMKVHGIHSNDAIRKEKVIELLEKVGLEADYYERYPHQFSGGQRQRICIARTLSMNPKFIICDESVSALDVSVQAQILNLLKDLKDEFDLSYIFITHDLSVVKFISDRIMVMQSGKIVEMNDTESILNNPQQQYTKNLLDAVM